MQNTPHALRINRHNFSRKNVDEQHQYCVSFSFLCYGQLFSWGLMKTLTARNPTSGRRTMNSIKNVNPTELNSPGNTSSALQRPEGEDLGHKSLWKLCSGYRLSLGHSEEEVWSFCFSIRTPCRAELGQL